jgi:hypothetical protein
MYVIYIYISVVFSAGMLTTFEKVVSLRTDYGMSATLPPTICMSSIFGELFFW